MLRVRQELGSCRRASSPPSSHSRALCLVKQNRLLRAGAAASSWGPSVWGRIKSGASSSFLSAPFSVPPAPEPVLGIHPASFGLSPLPGGFSPTFGWHLHVPATLSVQSPSLHASVLEAAGPIRPPREGAGLGARGTTGTNQAEEEAAKPQGAASRRCTCPGVEGGGCRGPDAGVWGAAAGAGAAGSGRGHPAAVARQRWRPRRATRVAGMCSKGQPPAFHGRAMEIKPRKKKKKIVINMEMDSPS